MSQVVDEELLSIVEPRWKDRVVRAPEKAPPLAFPAVVIAVTAVQQWLLIFIPPPRIPWLGILALAAFLACSVFVLLPRPRGRFHWGVLALALCTAAPAAQGAIASWEELPFPTGEWVNPTLRSLAALMDAVQLGSEAVLLLMGAIHVRGAMERSPRRTVASVCFAAAHVCMAYAALSMLVRAVARYGESAPAYLLQCWTFHALLLITLAVGLVLAGCGAILSPLLLGPQLPPFVLPGRRVALAEDVACEGCGYNLRTRCRGDLCPECGMLVEDSLVGRLRFGGLRPRLLAWACGMLAVLTLGGGIGVGVASRSYHAFHRVPVWAWIMLPLCLGLLVATILMAVAVKRNARALVVACAAAVLAAVILGNQGYITRRLLTGNYWIDPWIAGQTLMVFVLGGMLALLMEVVARRARVAVGGVLLGWLGIAALFATPAGLFLATPAFARPQLVWLATRTVGMFPKGDSAAIALMVVLPVAIYWTTVSLILFAAGKRPRRAAGVEGAGVATRGSA